MGGMRHTQVPFQSGKILDGPELYRALDRPDLVEAYHHRVVAKATLVTLGLVGLAVGGVITGTTIPGQACETMPPNNPWAAATISCHETGGGAAHTVGIGIMLASPLVFLAGMLIRPDPVGTTERDGLIEGSTPSTRFLARRSRPPSRRTGPACS
jgi:hypothetical protein